MSKLCFTNNEKKTSLIFILLLILIIDLISFTCILPLFPSILDYYSQNLSMQFFTTNNTIAVRNICLKLIKFFFFFRIKITIIFLNILNKKLKIYKILLVFQIQNNIIMFFLVVLF